MSKKRMKTRLGADGYDYPYTSEGLVFDSEGKSIDQKYATKKDLESLSIVDELEERVSANEESIAWLLENGGGGGGTISCYISTTDAENFIISTGNDLTLHLDFFSPNVGKGTLKVFINDVESKSITIAQGDTANIIEGSLFNTGSNTMRVYVVDRTGNLTNELTFYVRYGSTQITSTFDPYISYDYGSIIRYYFTVTALDTSDTLTFYIKIDDELQNPISCKSEVRAYFTFPSTLSVGSHYCEAWAEDSVGKSNILKFNIVILDDRAVVVASDTQTLSVEEGSQVSLDYKVYMKNNTTFITKIYIDNEYSSSGTCGLETSFYKTSDLKEGIHTIKLEVWDINETVSDYVTWTVTITPSTYEMVTATTAGSTAIFTAMNRLNSDENRETWIGTNQDGGQIVANLSNFAFNSESGWVDDNLIMSGNSAVEIPITPLANNAKYGFTLDIEFTSKAIGVEDALVLKLWDDTNNCGIKITTEELILRSKENNECRLYFTDNENTSVMFIIDRDEGFAKIYLNGVMCEAFHLNDYTVNGVAYLEDFTVNDTIKLGGSGYCQIKNLRVYEIALATNEILNNFISNETNKEAQRMLVEFQKGDNLPTLTIYGDFSGLGKDEKKPCDIVYMSTDVTKYGESFTLGGKKSSLQYQGTSSMAYPIKNYRINLCDSLGNKWKYNPFSGGQPESRFCLKADFITSNHAHNTGMAKFISDKLYNYDTSDESTMNPAKWWSINNGGKLTDTRETINGFPCRLILVNDGDTALNEGQAEPTPGNTKDMGIFNFNNDKDNVASLGLDNEIFPNCLSYEVTANSDTSAGAFVPFTSNEYYVDCFDNGYDKRTTTYIEIDFFKDSNITVTTELGTRYTLAFYDEDINWTTNIERDSGTSYNLTSQSNAKYVSIQVRNLSSTFFTVNDMTFIFNEMNPNNNKAKNPIPSTNGELEYLQNSFELRYPDADDYGEDYGYLGIEEELNKVDYYLAGGGTIYWSSQIEHDYFGSNELIVSDNVSDVIVYDASEQMAVRQKVNGKVDIMTSSDYPYIAIRWKEPFSSCTVNGIKLYPGEQISSNMVKENPRIEKGFSQDYGLKRVIDWVGNATNEEFVADFDKYFDRHYTLRYYLLVVLIAGVDNLGKNMMLDTFDGQIWYPRFYDIDTILSYDNSGEIKFDVDIEMEQGYWNTSASRLWTKIRDNFHDELVEVYKQMRGNGVTYEQIMHYMYDEQIAKIPQTYYNKDFDIKYAPYADQYIGKAHGDGYEHMKRWLKRRFTFCDTLFDYAPSYENDVLTIRANTLEEMHLTIDTYTPLYQHVSFYNGNMEKIKITPGQPITFSGFAQTATDQEVLIYGGNNIKKITGISTCNPNSMLIGFAPRLTELDISNCPILTIVNSNKANFSPHTYLNKLNISNCPQLGGNLNVSNSPLLQEINARGSAITGLLLPTSLRNLKTLELPNTISSLALYDAGVLENLKFDEGVAMQSIELSNCPGITNTENFDLTQTPTVILDNSYDTEELYMSATTNLTLRNMKNMERIIYTPNAEYSEFDINNVINGKNYKITTSSCPKLSTFMTTAPHRNSYNGDDVEWVDKEIIETIWSEENTTITDLIDCAGFNTSTGEIKEGGTGCGVDDTYYIIDNSVTYKVSTDGSWLYIAGYNENKEFTGGIYTGAGSAGDNKTFTTNCYYLRVGAVTPTYITIEGRIGKSEVVDTVQVKDYGDITPNTSFTANTLDLSATQFSDIKFLCTTDVYNLKIPTSLKNFYCDSAMDIDTDVIEEASYEVIHNELIEEYTTNYEGNVYKYDTFIEEYGGNLGNMSYGDVFGNTSTWQGSTDYIKIIPGTDVIVTQKTVTTQENTLRVRGYDIDKQSVEDYLFYGTDYSNQPQKFKVADNVEYIRIQGNYGRIYEVITQQTYTPNIIPSSANGSLIFNMYSNNTTQPTSTSPYMWDLTGLKLEDFYTYGMNNWVKPSDNVVRKYSEILPRRDSCKYGGTVGSTIRCSTALGGGYSIPPIKVKEGDTISHKCKDGYGTRWQYHFTDDNNIYISGNDSYNTSDTTVIAPSGATKLWITITTIHVTHSGDYLISDINGVRVMVDKNRQNSTNVSEQEILSMNPILLDGDYILTDTPTSISMPQRMPGYSVRLVNADITPNEYPTMLYPKLIDITLPITGKLDYTKYNGSSLAWAYAYTTDDVDIQPVGSQEQVNITNDYNKLYGTDFIDIVDVWVYKDTDTSKLSNNENITKAYIELTSSNYGTRVDEVLAYYPNCTDLYFFDDGSVTNLNSIMEVSNGSNSHRFQQIQTVTFMEGYFDNLTSLSRAFRHCHNLTKVTNIPNSVEWLDYTFEFAYELQDFNIPTSLTRVYYLLAGNTAFNKELDFSNCPIRTDGLSYGFATAKGLKIPPILPSNYTGSMKGIFHTCSSLTQAPTIPQGVTNMSNAFQNCTSLTTAPTIPNGVTNMQDCFNGCSKLTTVPNIPSSCTNFITCFNNCTNLTSVPTDGWKGELDECFRMCTSLNQQINIDNATDLYGMFDSCTSLTIAPTISSVSNCRMENCFLNCTALTTAPTIPNGVNNITRIFDGCSSLTTATIPLGNFGQGYTNGLRGCKNLQDLDWEGELNASFSMTLFFSYCSERDIKELVPEHLADLTTNIYTIKNRIANINGMEFDLNSHQAYYVGNLIIGTNGSWGGYPNAGCGLFQKAILNGVEIIPILDTSGNPCFLNTSNGSLYYDSMGGTMTVGSVIGTYDGYSRLNYIKAENCYVVAEDIEIDINTHDLEYHLLVDASQSATNRHCVNFLGSCGTNIRFYYPAGSFHNTSSNFRTGSATLTLGTTYGAYLTPDEVFSANAKGWTIVGASSDFTIVNASVDASTLTTDESVLSCFIELTSANYKTRLNDVLGHYPNCTDLYFFDDGSVTTLYAMFDGNNTTYKAQIEKIVFIEGYFNNLTNFNNMFSGLNTSTNGVDYDLRGLANASKNTTSLAGMFQYNKINSINFDGWDGSNIKDIANMFQYTAISIVDLSALDLSNVENMSGAFRYTNQNLKEIKINSDFSKVTNLNDCFHNCYALNQEFDFSKATSLIATGLQNTFYNCQALTYPPLLPNQISNGNMGNAFLGCTSLTTPPIIPEGVTNMATCFQGCTSLTQPPIIPNGVTSMQYCFQNCTSLTTTPIIPQGVTNMANCFQNCTSLTTPPNIPSSVTNINVCFNGCTSLINGAVLHEGILNTVQLYLSCSSLETVQYPLTNSDGGGGYAVFQGATGKIKEFTWIGERKTNLSVLRMFDVIDRIDPNVKPEWIQDLVPEHLDDVYKDEIKISFSKKEITINNTKTTWEEE